MKKFLILKMKGTSILGRVVAQTLEQLVADGTTPHATIDKTSTLFFSFMSDSSIDDVVIALKDIMLRDYFVTEVSTDTFRAELNKELNDMLELNSIGQVENITDGGFTNTSDKDLESDLQNALVNEDYEGASILRDEIANRQNLIKK